MMAEVDTKIRHSREDKVFYAIVYTIVTLLTLAVFYPLIYIVACSFSSGAAVTAGKVRLWPVDFSLISYKAVFEHGRVWIGYRNTIFYTLFGTLNNVIVTVICAYPLSRSDLPGKKWLIWFFMFTMYFSGGLIPNYLLRRDLGMLDTIWVMVTPGAFAVYQMIVVRTFIINSIPNEMLEAAKIDGCNDFNYLVMFVVPLSKAVIAVITLQYAIGHWNSYFSAFIYLNSKELQPLQIFLREILCMNQIDTSEIHDPMLIEQLQGVADLLKYSLIVVATVPILCIYPFVQKYFVKGVMIGSLKG
jgi:putative aldouronate transport system permease protein